jgi:hypothetical protein
VDAQKLVIDDCSEWKVVEEIHDGVVYFLVVLVET